MMQARTATAAAYKSNDLITLRGCSCISWWELNAVTTRSHVVMMACLAPGQAPWPIRRIWNGVNGPKYIFTASLGSVFNTCPAPLHMTKRHVFAVFKQLLWIRNWRTLLHIRRADASHPMAALFCVKWRHGRRLESGIKSKIWLRQSMRSCQIWSRFDLKRWNLD